MFLKNLDLSAITQCGVIGTNIFNKVGIIDAKSIYALANLPATGQADLSERAHVTVYRTRDMGEIFLSKPAMDRPTGKWHYLINTAD